MISKEDKFDIEEMNKIIKNSLRYGIFIDEDKLYSLCEKLSKEVKIYNIKCIEELGFGINLNYNEQVKKVLHDVYGIKQVKNLEQVYLDTGNMFVYYLIKYRESYSELMQLKEIIRYLKGDRVYPKFSYSNTYRVNYKEPFLSGLDKDLRCVLGVEPGYKIISADYKAQEVFILINVLHINNLIDIYEESDDFYTGVFKGITGKELDPMYRDKMKLAWLAGIYGSNLKNISNDKVETDIFNIVKSEIESIKEIREFRGYIQKEMIPNKHAVESYFGTKHYLQDSDFFIDFNSLVNKVFNNTFQMTGSDVLFFACKRAFNLFEHNNLKGDEIRIYFTLYDEILFYVKEDLINDDLINLIKEALILDIDDWCKPKIDIEIKDHF